jgi:hypothetical protein
MDQRDGRVRQAPGPRLTPEQAAEQLARMAWMRCGERLAVNADIIAK